MSRVRSSVVAVAAALILVLVGACRGSVQQAPRPASLPPPVPAHATAGAVTGHRTPAVPGHQAPPVPAMPAVWAVPVVPPAAPPTPAALFAQLVPVEEQIHGRGTALARVPALGAVEQRDIAVLADHPPWLASLPAGTPPAVQAAIRAAATGDRELGAVPGPTPTAIPRWRIVAPQPAAALLAYYHEGQAATGVPWTVLAAIHLVETRMGRIQGPSTAGAQGPMQFEPATWAEFGGGGDIRSDRDAILAAARLLSHDGAARDLPGAVYRYNHSDHYVRGVLAYASSMQADVRSFYGFYGWRVYVTTTAGGFLLPEGYANTANT